MIGTLKKILSEKIVVLDLILVLIATFAVLVPPSEPVGTLKLDENNLAEPIEEIIEQRLFYQEGVDVERLGEDNYSITVYRNDSDVEYDIMKAISDFAELQGNFTYGENITRCYITAPPVTIMNYFLKQELGEEPRIIDAPDEGTYKISFNDVYTPKEANILAMEKLGEVLNYENERIMRWNLGLDLQGGSWIQLEIKSTLVEIESTSYGEMAALQIDSQLDTNTSSERGVDISGKNDNR